MSATANDAVRAAVREAYSQVASSCCDASSPAQLDSTMLGYSDDDLAAVPDGADLGLGCGNPGAIAAMKTGETVLDLGSGAGFDAFLAARAVGPNGRVIGVDMKPTMDKAAVFADAYRVLRPGGRLAISDVVASAELPDEIRNDLGLYSGCMAGESLISDVRTMLVDAGFDDVVIAPKDESKSFIEQWAPGRSITDYMVSATIQAAKPAVRAGLLLSSTT